MEAFTENKSTFKEAVNLQGLHTILIKSNKLWRSEKAKQKEFGIVGAVIMEGKHWKKRIDGKDYFVGFYTDSLVLSPTLVVKIVLPFLVE